MDKVRYKCIYGISEFALLSGYISIKRRKDPSFSLTTKGRIKISGTLISMVSFFIRHNYQSIHSDKLIYIYGNKYDVYKQALIQIGVLHLSNYEIGKKSTKYSISQKYLKQIKIKTFEIKEIGLQKIYLKYLGRENEYDKKHKSTQWMSAARNPLEEDFLAALSLVRVLSRAKLNKFNQNYLFRNDEQKDYYRKISKLWTQKQKGPTFQIKVDQNQRIYSILTETPRLLRPFLNIRWSADIHNSHPLLVVKLIEDRMGFTMPTRLKLIELVRQIELVKIGGYYCYMSPWYGSNVHHWLENGSPISFGENANQVSLYKAYEGIKRTLYANATEDMEKEEIEKMEPDMLEYIILAMKGRLWDSLLEMVTDKDGDKTRQDVKMLMFAEVFYSSDPSTRSKTYGKLFKDYFPNVYWVIQELKKEDSDHLANRMMKLESQLFRKILAKIYERGFKVVTIHDAIEVIDVPENDACTKELVKDIMVESYNEAGLDPDVSFDDFGRKAMQQAMEELGELVEYRKKLEDEAKQTGTGQADEARVLLEKLDSGNYELIKDKGEIRVHKILDKERCRLDSISNIDCIRVDMLAQGSSYMTDPLSQPISDFRKQA